MLNRILFALLLMLLLGFSNAIAQEILPIREGEAFIAPRGGWFVEDDMLISMQNDIATLDYTRNRLTAVGALNWELETTNGVLTERLNQEREWRLDAEQLLERYRKQNNPTFWRRLGDGAIAGVFGYAACEIINN